ncbi:MAG: hypothetical protein Q7T70_06665 [Polaromonas sp.]|nr:hypothetical protein [Polaromonas sp.]
MLPEPVPMLLLLPPELVPMPLPVLLPGADALLDGIGALPEPMLSLAAGIAGVVPMPVEVDGVVVVLEEGVVEDPGAPVPAASSFLPQAVRPTTLTARTANAA